MQTLAQKLARSERSKSMYRLPFRWTRGRTGVPKRLIVSDKATIKRAGTRTGALKKIILEILTGFSEKPRDRPVGKALITHQMETAS